MKQHFLLSAMLLAATFSAQAQRMPIERGVHSLLVAAIVSPDGTARGVMTGEVAQLIQQRMGSSHPIEVDVKTLRDLPQLGCKRLEVITRQKAVIEPGKPRQDMALTYQISFCANGTFPAPEGGGK